jgi:aspartyl-tRNA(Asn)/glutamyl-tRNA(Gln) amidotransferase subunit A
MVVVDRAGKLFDRIAAGEVSSLAALEAMLAATERWDPTIGCFIARFDDSARKAAASADAARAAGRSLGTLHGVPVAVKDILATREGPTTAQSVVDDPGWERGRDATSVARLRAAGAVIVGKTTTMEYALGFPDTSKPFPHPRNPWDPRRYAGGSSSGSASGVAAGLFCGALGTDTGGSIRMPSAFCGVSGLKPTYGRVSRAGCLPLGWSLDHVGPIARSARDCARLLGAMAGSDPADRSAASEPVPDYLAALDGELAGVRIGVDRLERVAADCTDPALGPCLDDALAALAQRGAEIIPFELPFYDELTTADVVILASEGAAFHMARLRERWGDYGEATRTILGGAALYSGADYVQAQRAREVGRAALEAAMAERRLDLVVTPTLGLGAVPFDERADIALGPKWPAMFVGYWDSVGFPALTVPIGTDDNEMPLAMQICGRPFDEAAVLRAGDAFQRQTDWHLREPRLPATTEATRA